MFGHHPGIGLRKSACTLALLMAVGMGLVGCSSPLLPAPGRSASGGEFSTAVAEENVYVEHQVGHDDNRYPISRHYLDNLPNASVLARAGEGEWFFLSPRKIEQSKQYWVSEDNRRILATRQGRLVRTVGFEQDLTFSDLLREDPVLVGLHRLEAWGNVSQRTIDLTVFKGNNQMSEPASSIGSWLNRETPEEPLRDHYGVMVRCLMEGMGESRIELLERSYPVVHVKEACDAELLGWRFVNQFWADTETGKVRRSIQYFSPEHEPLELWMLEAGKPVSGGR
ncbi:MAG: YjbF family lipoprotein [Magnetococcales bacterium]|nr:YjbF family lipoprotein [Magnetococcales bacterium]